MDYSFASYLLPAAIQANKPMFCRVKFAGQHLDFMRTHSRMEVKTQLGSFIKKVTKYEHGLGSVTVKPCPMVGPISEVLQKHCGLDPTTVKLEDFQVFEMVEKKENRSYYNSPGYEEGEPMIINWSQPWHIPGQTCDVLTTLCDNNKENIRSVVTELTRNMWVSKVGNLETSQYLRSLNVIQLKAPGKPLTPRCVFLKSGAIYNYNENKVVANNLESWLADYLGLESAVQVTWDTIYNHLIVGNVGLPTALAAIKIEKDRLEKRKIADFWKQVDSKIRDGMPFLNGGMNRKYYKNGTTQLLAFVKSSGKIQTYFLDMYGIRRRYDEEPQPKGWPTEEERTKRQEWQRPFHLDDMKILAANPDTQWYAQVYTKWSHSQFEPIDLLQCL